jgi:hypothetical protein
MALQDVLEIQNLLYSYCWLIDSGDFQGVCDLMKDADILYGGKLTFSRDPEGYMQTFNPIITYKDGTPKTAHMCIDPIIEVAEDGLTATSKSYTVVTQGVTKKFQPQIIWIDRKYDTFVKENGKWKFRSRDFVTRAQGDTSHHMDPTIPAIAKKK